MADCNVTMWNCSGLRATTVTTLAKMALFDKENPNASYTIAAFVETHHRHTDDFPSYISQQSQHFHILHTPTTTTHAYSGIILLISKEYDILKENIVIPGRLINIRIAHKMTKHQYNISVYYGNHLENMKINEMEDVGKQFNAIHKIADNNVIIGDFNFADNNIDKGKGQNSKDKSFTNIWNNFKKECNITDPYRKKYPQKNYTPL